MKNKKKLLTGVLSVSMLATPFIFTGCDDTTSPTTETQETEYTITYELNGGVNSSNNVTKYKKSSSNIVLKDASRTGYVFEGWYTTSNFVNGSKVIQIAQGSEENMKLYAKFTPETYSIEYKLADGSVITGHQNPTFYTIESENINLLAASKENMIFKGWYSDKDFTNPVNSIVSGSMGNVTLYANFANYDAVVTDQQGLEDAIASASSDVSEQTTIILANDITVNESIVISKGNVLINLNGHAITVAEDAYISNSILVVDTLATSVEDTKTETNIQVSVSNGYIGNFNDDRELMETENLGDLQTARIGMSINGGENVKVVLNGVYIAGHESGFATNGSEKYKGSEITIMNSYIYSTMTANDDGAGAYLGGYATYNIYNTTFEGATAIYAKSGTILLDNCILVATGDEISPVHSGNGYWPTGDALVVNSAYGYQLPLDVTISGGTYSSENGYAIHAFATAPSGEEMQPYATIVGYETATLNTEKSEDVMLTGGLKA